MSITGTAPEQVQLVLRAKVILQKGAINLTKYELRISRSERKRCKKSFKKLKGDCGKFSAVFSALCRAVGIPAGTVTCIWFTGNGHQ